MTLNGWQRLWVLVATLWASIVFPIAYVVWPRPMSDEDLLVRAYSNVEIASATNSAGSEAPGWFEINKPRNDSAALAARPAGEALSTDPNAGKEVDYFPERTYRVTAANGAKAELVARHFPSMTEIDQAFKSAGVNSGVSLDRERSRALLRRAGTVAGVAFFPPALLYALGWGIAWVRRGFRQA